MYNALVRALQCHFFAGKDIRYVEFVFPPLLKPEKEKFEVIFQVMLVTVTVLHRFTCCFISLKEKCGSSDSTKSLA